MKTLMVVGFAIGLFVIASMGLLLGFRYYDQYQKEIIKSSFDKGENCDPAYPAVCIPSPPPDLNCIDVPYTNFAVLKSDPHHFDDDYDGIGCEVETGN